MLVGIWNYNISEENGLTFDIHFKYSEKLIVYDQLNINLLIDYKNNSKQIFDIKCSQPNELNSNYDLQYNCDDYNNINPTNIQRVSLYNYSFTFIKMKILMIIS